MTKAACSEQEFALLFESLGAVGTARKLGVDVRGVRRRRRRIEQDSNTIIEVPRGPAQSVNLVEHPQRACYEIEEGTVLVGSDAHYWPNYVTTAHRGFVKACKELDPKIIVLNGDVVDGATISRFPPQNWESLPSLAQELETVKERLQEIQDAAPNAKRVWTLGNHDQRFESKLAQVAPEYADIHGVHLKDHFPYWEPAWAVWINDDTVIKHRFKGGIYAPRNNTLISGVNMITGHLHSQKVMPHTNYLRTTWGVDGGCLADPFGPQFAYAEDNPRDWRSGFVVLTFHGGQLLPPELATVWGEDEMVFRGKVYAV